MRMGLREATLRTGRPRWGRCGERPSRGGGGGSALRGATLPGGRRRIAVAEGDPPGGVGCGWALRGATLLGVGGGSTLRKATPLRGRRRIDVAEGNPPEGSAADRRCGRRPSWGSAADVASPAARLGRASAIVFCMTLPLHLRLACRTAPRWCSAGRSRAAAHSPRPSPRRTCASRRSAASGRGWLRVRAQRARRDLRGGGAGARGDRADTILEPMFSA